MKIFSLDVRQSLPFILLVFGIFLFECLPFVMYGTSLDGLVYSQLALNMSHHLGSLWDPFYSSTIWPHFYEHPPLAFYLQSFFFSILGDNVFVDQFYFFTIIICNLFLFVFFWRQSNPKIKGYFIWIPIFCFLIGPRQVSNLGYLEYMLSVFTTLASFLIVKALLSGIQQRIYFLLSGVLMVAAFFINGLQAFFPLIIPLLYALIFSKPKFLSSVLQTLGLTFWVFSLIIFIFLIYPPAFENIYHYFQEQLIESLSGMRQDSGYHSGFFGHLYGLGQLWPLLWTLIVTSLISLLIYSWQTRQSFLNIITMIKQDKWVLFFFLMAFSAFLPVLLSARQSPHYFIPALSFFGLAFAQILTPVYLSWLSLIDINSQKYKIFLCLVIFTMIGAVIGMIFSFGKINYSKNTELKQSIHDALLIAKIVPPNTEIFTDDPAILVDFNHPAMSTNIDNIAILNRYAHITIYIGPLSKNYLVQMRSRPSYPLGYELVNLELQKFSLFKKKK